MTIARRSLLAGGVLLATAAVLPRTVAVARPTLTVYKSPT
jgi:hypothetical protein